MQPLQKSHNVESHLSYYKLFYTGTNISENTEIISQDGLNPRTYNRSWAAIILTVIKRQF